MRKDLLAKAWALSQQSNASELDFNLTVEDLLINYEDKLEAAHKQGVSSDHARVWDFWNALFFCATVFTTIGRLTLLQFTYLQLARNTI